LNDGKQAPDCPLVNPLLNLVKTVDDVSVSCTPADTKAGIPERNVTQ